MSVAFDATTTAVPFLESTTTRDPTIVDPVLSERERIRMEFYQTYDPMTGIRIALTLGSFFTMMVLLVLYKSKCKSRANESLEAAITAVVAEEEELEAVLNQSKYHGPRQSLGNMSAPTYTRFSSVGGYGGLMNPPSRRYDRGTKGRTSLPASDISFRYFTSAPTSISSQEQKSPHMWKSYNEEEENELEEVEENEDSTECEFLQIPQNSRCKLNANSNAGQFYFDRRGSCSRATYHCALNKEFKRSSFNHPNIQVIQATPQISPSESSSTLQENQSSRSVNVEPRLAPLASIGSCSVISSIESENRSVGSDSVFITNETIEEDDTDKDQNEEELSSAKSDQDFTNKKYSIVPVPRHNSCFVISGNRILNRRFSDSEMLDTAAERTNVSLFPIVTNMANNANNQITTSLYDKRLFYESSSSTSSSSDFSYSISTSSDKQRKGIFSRITIIDTNKSPVKSEVNKLTKTNFKFQLSKSEPKTINTSSEYLTTDLKTLSLKNLLNAGLWSKETLF